MSQLFGVEHPQDAPHRLKMRRAGRLEDHVLGVLLGLCQGVRSYALRPPHSCQSSSPPDFWYEQSEHEWVVLLQGSAQLQFADEAVPRQLSQGDCLLISAGRRHRVVSTDPAPGCVWLALFWPPADAG